MEKTGGSRLLQMQAIMQARFQQKQLQEREHKITSLYEAQQARALDRVRHSPGTVSASPPAPLDPLAAVPTPPPATHQPGKVRQMFEERRTKAGIDKSYPLQPIHNTERAQKKELSNGYSSTERIQHKKELTNGYSSTERIQQKKELTNGYSSTEKTQQKRELSNGYISSVKAKTVEKKVSKTHSVTSNVVKKQSVKQTKVGKMDNVVNGSGDVNHNHVIDIKPTKTPQTNGDILNNYEKAKSTLSETDTVENNYLIENETFPEALAPAPTPRAVSAEKKNPEPKQPEPKSLKKSPPPRQPKAPVKVKPQASVTSAPSPRPRNVVEKKPVSSRPRTGMERPPKPSGSSLGGARRGVTADGEGCVVCGRRFAPDRLAKHQEICKKTSTKKRKPYDVLKHRLAGTEAEPFINKLRRGAAPAASASKTQAPAPSNWRQKHEEFIQAIRAAKQVQAHLNAGGKLSDLPPPPSSVNPDYVQCPHCNRRFNQTAAERHIPKCATFRFKPKKLPAKRR